MNYRHLGPKTLVTKCSTDTSALAVRTQDTSATRHFDPGHFGNGVKVIKFCEIRFRKR